MSLERFKVAFMEGDFEGAIEAIEGLLRAGPSAELVLMAFGTYANAERADKAIAALDRLAELEPRALSMVAHLKGCVSCDRTRRDRLVDAELAGHRTAPGPPPPHTDAHIKAAVLHAGGDFEGARAALEEARRLTPQVAGLLTFTSGEQRRFTDLRDSDDLIGPHLQVFAGDTLLDVAFTELRKIERLPPRASWDALWAQADLTLQSGEVLQVRIPTMYPGTGQHEDSFIRLGRMTTWDYSRGYAQAIGMVDLKCASGEGEAMVGIANVAALEFDSPPKKKGGLFSRLLH